MKKLLTILTILCCMLFSCAIASAQDNYITAEGRGIPRVDETNENSLSFQKPLARTAAYADACQMLLGKINGIQIDATTTIKNLMLDNQEIHTRVHGFLKNVSILDEYYEGAVCYMTVGVPLYNETNPQNSLASAVFTPNPNPRPFPTPTTTQTKLTVDGTPYTGVIIDCKGLGLKTAMSPVIKDSNGKKLYGHENIDTKFICKNGMAGYTSDIQQASRAGDNPLIIRATSVEGGVNPIINAEDANMMLLENQKSHFLNNCKVVFIK